MNGLQARVDRAAEQMERAGHYVLAAVLDNVSEQLDEDACGDDTCEESDADFRLLGSPGAVQASFPTIKPVWQGDGQPDLNPTAILTNNASRLFESVKQYGARAYRVDSDGVEVQLDRDGVETTAQFQFCSRDEAGNPQLRMTFRCGDDKMVRWASLSRLGGDELVSAATHVFGTGENYGAGVVVASRVTAADAPVVASVDYELVDQVEQAVHDGRGSPDSLRRFSPAQLRSVAAHLDDWTARIVRRLAPQS